MVRASTNSHTARAAACLADIGREWTGGDTPLRTVLRRRQDRMHALDSKLRRAIEAVLFAYARHRGEVDAGLQALIEPLSPALRPDVRTQWLARWYLLSRQHRTRWPVELDELLSRDLRQSMDKVRLTALPEDDLSQEIKAQLPAAEIDAALRDLQQRAPLVLRTRHVPADDVCRQLAQDGVDARPHRLLPQAVVVDPPRPLHGHALMRQKQVQVQDVSSQLACLALGIEPGQVVADYCAGGGGKALALADLLHGKGRLLLLDDDRRRLASARQRLSEAGHNKVEEFCGDGRNSAPIEWQGRVDRVLVDAPCSGLGRVRRQPELRWRYQPDDIERFAANQLALLRSAATLLKPGGLLLYCTCSLRRAENDQVVKELLASSEDLQARALASTLESLLPDDDLTGHSLTLWPHRHDCDGFFMSLIKKIGLATPRRRP